MAACIRTGVVNIAPLVLQEKHSVANYIAGIRDALDYLKENVSYL